MAFNQETADKVLEKISEGLSLREACRQVGANARTVLDWTEANPEFGAHYAHTRARAYEMLADEIVGISDETAVEAKYNDEDVTLALDATAVARNRLRVDTRKWMLSKMLPKVYGDKLELGGSLTVKKQAADMSDDELAAIAFGRKQNSLTGKVPENTAFDLPAIENGSNGDNNA